MNSLTSIILPTHNGFTRGFLSYSIESVLNQTYSNFELLVIDDGSSDETKELVKKYFYDSRVRYFYQKNSGVSCARNRGIKNSLGKYVCFLDDDDVWLPEKLEKQINFIKKIGDSRFGLCYTALEIIRKKGNKTGVIQSHRAKGSVFEEMLCDNLVDCTSSVIVHKKIFDDVGFFREDWSHAEDYDLWLRIAKKYNIYSIDEPLVLYREHENKLSADLEKIESYTLKAVFDSIEGKKDLDKNFILNSVYKNKAKYRFWLGDYKIFRKYIKSASRYGGIEAGLKVRFLLSHFPRAIKFFKKLVQKRS